MAAAQRTPSALASIPRQPRPPSSRWPMVATTPSRLTTSFDSSSVALSSRRRRATWREDNRSVDLASKRSSRAPRDDRCTGLPESERETLPTRTRPTTPTSCAASASIAAMASRSAWNSQQRRGVTASRSQKSPPSGSTEHSGNPISRCPRGYRSTFVGTSTPTGVPSRCQSHRRLSTSPPRRETTMAKVLVTGSAGFIGGYIVEELLRGGHEVVGIDNYSKYGPVKKSYDDHPNYKLYVDDVEKTDLMVELCSGVDHVIAGAALIGGISYFHTYAYDLLAQNERIIASTVDAAIKAPDGGK